MVNSHASHNTLTLLKLRYQLLICKFEERLKLNSQTNIFRRLMGWLTSNRVMNVNSAYFWGTSWFGGEHEDGAAWPAWPSSWKWVRLGLAAHSRSTGKAFEESRSTGYQLSNESTTSWWAFRSWCSRTWIASESQRNGSRGVLHFLAGWGKVLLRYGRFVFEHWRTPGSDPRC